MSEENVYLNPSSVDSIRINDAGESIKVKDNIQLVKLQGPPGPPGPPGEPFRYDDFTPEQLNALKGPKGDPGDSSSVTVDKVHDWLLENNVFVKDNTVEGVLMAAFQAINSVTQFARPYTSLSISHPFIIGSVEGNDVTLVVSGYDHYKAQVNNGEPVEIVNGAAVIPIAIDTRTFNVKYINMLGQVVQEATVNRDLSDYDPTAVAETFEGDAATFILKGGKLTIKIKPTGTSLAMPDALNTKLGDVKTLEIDCSMTNHNTYNPVDYYFIPTKVNIKNYNKQNSPFSINFKGSAYGPTEVKVNGAAKFNQWMDTNFLQSDAFNGVMVVSNGTDHL